MKQKILPMIVAACFSLAAHAQKKSGNVTAYAITATEKGGSKWAEVKLIDMVTGEEIQSVYQSNAELQPLNARTKNPVKKDQSGNLLPFKNMMTLSSGDKVRVQEIKDHPGVFITIEPNVSERKVIRCMKMVNSDAPFATNSAACAYDKKHQRLYYTPMGINQLRYIDLKSANPTIYYFEDEPLGALNGPGDVQNQVTRMTIGSDGNGYALTNNSEHLIRFNTNKKAVISDLGALVDAASNGSHSIQNRGGYGGDMVADNAKNLFVITGNRMIFKVDIKSLVATYLGNIKGLPAGFTTNGAVVEEGNNIIVTSSTNTTAYYKFSLDNLQAVKLSTGSSVFNASDLANSNLISEKKKKKEEKTEQEVVVNNDPEETAAAEKTIPADNLATQKVIVYPNPVTNGQVKLSFVNYLPGTYEVQLIDLNGKSINATTATINSKMQVLEYNLNAAVSKGTYLLKVVNSSNKIMNIEKIIVQ
ncbi:MAG: T9SS type A sorting domain-containing protein [Ferruginibacter sp.]